MTDEMIRSMKAQMEPSDDVVAELLSMIAAESSSPVTPNDNLVAFRKPVEDRLVSDSSAGKKAKNAKKSKKSIWYYGTAIAASLILFISTFVLLDASGNVSDGSALKNIFKSILNPDLGYHDDTLITDPDRLIQPGDNSDPISQPGNNPSDDITNVDDVTDPDDEGKDTIQQSDFQPQNDENYMVYPNANSQPNSINNALIPSLNNNEKEDKITPGAPGTQDISWTNEIINTNAVSSISVSGSDYVVESTASKADVGPEIKSVTINLPQTSSTNAAKLHAKVRTVNNVSADAMIALDVEGFSEPLIYTNTEYTPATLGEFISDLGLSGNTSFSDSIRCQTVSGGKTSHTTYVKNINSAAWQYLLGDGSAGRL